MRLHAVVLKSFHLFFPRLCFLNESHIPPEHDPFDAFAFNNHPVVKPFAPILFDVPFFVRLRLRVMRFARRDRDAFVPQDIAVVVAVQYAPVTIYVLPFADVTMPRALLCAWIVSAENSAYTSSMVMSFTGTAGIAS